MLRDDIRTEHFKRSVVVRLEIEDQIRRSLLLSLHLREVRYCKFLFRYSLPEWFAREIRRYCSVKEKRNGDDMREFPSISEFNAEMKVERGLEVVEDCEDSDGKEN